MLYQLSYFRKGLRFFFQAGAKIRLPEQTTNFSTTFLHKVPHLAEMQRHERHNARTLLTLQRLAA
ncbi:MAG: hypothetical protein MR446_09810, partial [Bacteroidales bacterium]|nr:hypothetical protein [Bacteroidales bacterium]